VSAVDDDGLFGMSVADMLSFIHPDLQCGDKGHRVSKPTRVYRVEMPNGIGPFNYSKEVYAVICSGKPGFNCDHLADVNHEQMDVTSAAFRQAHGHAEYACDSIASLNRWFPLPARRYLKTLGAKIAVYEVPKGGFLAVVGSGEVIFSKCDSKPVDLLDVETEKVS
jgi:hypothetical protein